jgi:CheY-like chemotaxis protein
MSSFGERSRVVYAALRARILTGECPSRVKLPGHLALAAEFGVSPVTVRNALARLAAEGLVFRETGRGTFVGTPTVPAVMIVEEDPAVCALLETGVERAGSRAVTASDTAQGLEVLEREPAISLVITDVRVPTKDAGLDFIRRVRRRWPAVPLAAVTGYPHDLADLLGKPECPVHILGKPVWEPQIEEILDLLSQRERAPERDGSRPSPLRAATGHGVSGARPRVERGH